MHDAVDLGGDAHGSRPIILAGLIALQPDVAGGGIDVDRNLPDQWIRCERLFDGGDDRGVAETHPIGHVFHAANGSRELDGPALLITRLHFTGKTNDAPVDADVDADGRRDRVHCQLRVNRGLNGRIRRTAGRDEETQTQATKQPRPPRQPPAHPMLRGIDGMILRR